MAFWDKFGAQSRTQVSKYAWAILLSVLKETGEVALEEFAAGLDEFRKQNKTPDGWTREEYLTYAIGRLKIIQNREIGPFVVDEVIDYCIERIVNVLEGKLESLDHEDPVDEPEPTPLPEPLPVPTPDPTPTPEPQPVPVPVPSADDYYYPVTFESNAFPPMERLKQGDRVYRFSKGSNEGRKFVVPFLGEQFPLFRQAIVDSTLLYVKEA